MLYAFALYMEGSRDMALINNNNNFNFNFDNFSLGNIGKKKESRNCPQCGYLFNGIVAVCPACGYELRYEQSSGAARQLAKKIEALEKWRNGVTDTISKKISGKDPTDEKIASLIKNFVVPNTKEDIFEFMLLASGNMDATKIAKKEHESDPVMKAWEMKFHQTYQKARLTFGNDIDFRKIQDIYDSKMNEIEAARPKGIFKLFS